MERGDGVAVEVELVLQRVEVVDHDARGAAAGRQVGEQPRNRVGCGHLALPLDPLHRPVGVVGQGDDEALDERLAEGDERVELRHHRVVAVEVREEEHIPALHEVDGAEAAELDLVGARVGKLLPAGGEEAEARGREGLEPVRQVLEVRRSDDVVPPAIDEAAPCHGQAQVVDVCLARRPRRAGGALGVGVRAKLGDHRHAASAGLRPHAAHDAGVHAEGLRDGQDGRRRPTVHVEL
mmetsp:Transcript_47652/g.146876  ORF Transcript_47652/g.146876 Transcript_47652/m.146876 type:complete len:237 (-) Transcript_47652:1106-1816(-)